MRSTAELRQLWAPPCKGPWVTVALYGTGRVSVRPTIVDAVKALNGVLIAYNYKTRLADTGAYNCRKIAGTSNYSLHAYGIALDINWQSNPYSKKLVTNMPPAMIKAIKAIRTNNDQQVWRWGGDFKGNKDAMHFEIACGPRDLAFGIRGSNNPTPPPVVTKPAPTPAPVTPPNYEDDDMASYIQDESSGNIFVFYGERFRQLPFSQLVRRQNLATLGGKPISVHKMHPWALAAFVIENDLIPDPVAKEAPK